MFRPGQQNFRDSNSKFQISTLEMFTAHKGFWFHIPFSNLVDLFSRFFPRCLEAFLLIFTWLLQPDLQLGTQHLRPMIGVQQYIKYFCHKQCKYTQPLHVPCWPSNLHRGLKLNSKISARKYEKKLNSPGPADFPLGS